MVEMLGRILEMLISKICYTHLHLKKTGNRALKCVFYYNFIISNILKTGF